MTMSIGSDGGPIREQAKKQQPIPGLREHEIHSAAQAGVLNPVIERTESAKETLNALGRKDLKDLVNKLDSLLERDPRLDGIFSLQSTPSDRLIASQVRLPFELANQLNEAQQMAFKKLTAAYGSYLAPFPDPSETEPLKSLVGYLTEKGGTWDMQLAVNRDGVIIAGVNGQQFPVDGKPPIRAAWNEHTWVNGDLRRIGIGSQMVEKWEQTLKSNQLIVAELDNPYASTTDPRMLDPNNPDRANLWLKEGHSMDPFGRLKFWGDRHGFKMLATKGADGQLTAVPYAQISMDPLSGQDACETLFAVVKLKDPTVKTIDTEQYRALYRTMQGSIDPNPYLHPEFARTMTAADSVKNILLLEPSSPEGLQALERAVRQRDERANAERDAKYCENLLRQSVLAAEEQAIVEANLQRVREKLKSL